MFAPIDLNRASVFIVFGAADPEQVAAEEVCRDLGIPFGYAQANGARVHPGNAYKADPEDFGGAGNVPTQCILFECKPAYVVDSSPEDGPEDVPTIVVDHHRPGDPGYGLPPSQYWEGSSIGQLCALLGVEPTPGLRMVAAADHCLHAAYRGECPGVNPDHLMNWRAQSRAAFQGRPVEEVLRDINKARIELTGRRVEWVETASGAVSTWDHPWAGAGDYGWEPYEVLPHFEETVPELPEAAAREGIPFTAVVKDRDGREKVVLQGATPAVISEWMESKKAQGMEVYGDPERGFAGYYR
jgi:hypothetical protein